MNFLAGFLLLWLPEEQAFWLLCFIVEDVLPDHFGRNMLGSLVDQKVLMYYMKVRMIRFSLSLSRSIRISDQSLPGFIIEGTASSPCALHGIVLSIVGHHNHVALLPVCELATQICTSLAIVRALSLSLSDFK